MSVYVLFCYSFPSVAFWSLPKCDTFGSVARDLHTTAVKVRMQATIPPPYSGTFDGISKITAKEGWSGLYKGIYPLWARQIPYTMMKFASFETIVEMIYARLPGSKNDYSKAAQTGVSFTGGYLAGILCAIVSHPADVMVSKLNAYREPGEAFGTVLSRIYKDIGFRGLWNGLPMRIVMIGTLTGLQWMIYVGFSRFPIIQFGSTRRSRITDTVIAGLFQDLHGLAHNWWSAAAGEEVRVLVEEGIMRQHLSNLHSASALPNSGGFCAKEWLIGRPKNIILSRFSSQNKRRYILGIV